MNIARDDKNFSLYSNCSNCKHSVERSKFDLTLGAFCYRFICKLDNCCHKPTACCKCWNGNKEDENDIR